MPCWQGGILNVDEKMKWQRRLSVDINFSILELLFPSMKGIPIRFSILYAIFFIPVLRNCLAARMHIYKNMDALCKIHTKEKSH